MERSTPQQLSPPRRSSGISAENVHLPIRQSDPARIQFYSENIYGAINCLNQNTHNSAQSDQSSPSSHVMLELKCLEHRPSPDKERPDDNKYDGDYSRSPFSLYKQRTFAMTRGKEDLFSTCLSFQNYTSGSDTIQCATGLSNGALGIHSFTNIYDYINTDEEEEQGDRVKNILDSAKSDNAQCKYINAYYHIFRNNPVSAIAWNAFNTQQIASSFSSFGYSRKGAESNFHVFIWDATRTTNESNEPKESIKPINKFSNNLGVVSMAWQSNSRLILGCQSQKLIIHDINMSSARNNTKMAKDAHDASIDGIEIDPYNSDYFATFSYGPAEPVKVWDVRKIDKPYSEINCHPNGISNASFVSAIAWDTTSEGMLSIATGNVIKTYNARSSGKPILSRISHADKPVHIAYPPKMKVKIDENCITAKRLLLVSKNGAINDIPTDQVAPIAISSRDGRIASAFGSYLFFSSTKDGPAAMEKLMCSPSEDISATMMRRVRCLHKNRYSTDATSNLQMLANDQDTLLRLKNDNSKRNDHCEYYLEQLEHLRTTWSWIERTERTENSYEGPHVKTLLHTGVFELLKTQLEEGKPEKKRVYNLPVYDSPSRFYAIKACGWQEDDIESVGNFERSAALACWKGRLDETVIKLQKGAEDVRTKSKNIEDSNMSSRFTLQYAEILELIAMCVAGYNSNGVRESPWKQACESLRDRPILTNNNSGSHKNYLRAICSFLLDSDPKTILYDKTLNLTDRIAFACKYLNGTALKEYLEEHVKQCLKSGNLEGLLITGLHKKGIELLQSYVDCTSDIQTAALISSRVILPNEWKKETAICEEWLSSYREYLNKNQMWQSRAMFDVGRAELHRKLIATSSAYVRRTPNHQKKKQMPTPKTQFPEPIHIRCNYCNKTLPLAKLGRKETIANNWLARQNQILPCCPEYNCRQPLPRCSICLLPMGCLNPYMELRREGNRRGQQRGGDFSSHFSSLATMPFAEWFTWCTTCNHGGHGHHYISWFKTHETCPVSNCNCRCNSDAVKTLRRPDYEE